MFLLTKDDEGRLNGSTANWRVVPAQVRGRVQTPGVHHVREDLAAPRGQPRLGVDVKVILKPPCIFCMENR